MMPFKFCITAQHLGNVSMVLRGHRGGREGWGLLVREFLKVWYREGQSNGPQLRSLRKQRQSILQPPLGD